MRQVHDVASGLKYLHENHIVHEDLKPVRVLRTTPHCTDFLQAKCPNRQARSCMPLRFWYLPDNQPRGGYNPEHCVIDLHCARAPDSGSSAHIQSHLS